VTITVRLSNYENPEGLAVSINQSTRAEYVTSFTRWELEDHLGPLDGKVFKVTTVKPKDGIFTSVPGLLFCSAGLRKAFKGALPKRLYLLQPDASKA
jgi:hypothetical protein